MLTSHEANVLADIGDALGPSTLAACTSLYREQQQAMAARYPAVAVDLTYGPHERHRLDLYRSTTAADRRPILLFVHGGGFVHGDKGGPDSWMNANVGRMAADIGLVGAVMNYRLAPEHMWPAGSEDVASAIDWLRANGGDFGGDPDQIFVVGTSAGAIHLAGYLKLREAARDIRGAILLSGLYGYTPLDDRDTVYYGTSAEYSQRAPGTAVAQTDIPLFVVCAERDPARFQTEFLALLEARCEAKGRMPRATIITGHNHYSLSMHLGSTDTRLKDEISSFIEEI